MKICLISAKSDNDAIGRDNQMPWHLSPDMRHFKALTTGQVCLMGRKTYESLGKPLPNRENVVITRQPDYPLPEGVQRQTSLEQALKTYATAEKIMVIGGAQLYEQCLPLADLIYLTQVHTTVSDADTFFPTIDPRRWVEVAREDFPEEPKSGLAYSFITLAKSTSFS
ncbi:MAG: hypothetical protein CMF48_01125 [Legionellales bacterium]|nr:hypothetical protein [Legionellales bacterium]|tara:strand:- start:6 stop:509 length:504 start_codon:yes stop_codon:yes gene_type:complete